MAKYETFTTKQYDAFYDFVTDIETPEKLEALDALQRALGNCKGLQEFAWQYYGARYPEHCEQIINGEF